MTPTTTTTSATPNRIGSKFESRCFSVSGDGWMRQSIHSDCTFGDLLLPADGQAVDSYGRARYCAAELEVVSDFGDMEEHFLQIAGYRDLFDWIGEFSAGNPEPR